MREVFVYVEGPSDQLGMRELFADIMDLAAEKGRKVDFYPLDGKEPLLQKGPLKAINILRNRPDSYVFLVPDLYPPNKPFPHTSYAELKNELGNRFAAEARRKGCDQRLTNRFFVHCFKSILQTLLVTMNQQVAFTAQVKPNLGVSLSCL